MKIRKLGDYLRHYILTHDIYEQFGLMMDSLKELRSILQTFYDQWHRKIMTEFLESDLPLELYNLYNLSYVGKTTVIKSIMISLSKLDTRLHLVISNEGKIVTELRKFNKRHKILLEMFMSTSSSEFTLKFFLKSANAKEMEDLFRTKPLTLNTITERKRFEEYLDNFRQHLFKLTNHLDKKYHDELILLNSSDSKAFDDFAKNPRHIILRYA